MLTNSQRAAKGPPLEAAISDSGPEGSVILPSPEFATTHFVGTDGAQEWTRVQGYFAQTRTSAELGHVLDGAAFEAGGGLAGLPIQERSQARLAAIRELQIRPDSAATTMLRQHFERIGGDSPEMEATITALASHRSGLMILIRSLESRPDLRTPVMAALGDHGFLFPQSPSAADADQFVRFSDSEIGDIYREISRGFTHKSKSISILSMQAAARLATQYPSIATTLRKDMLRFLSDEPRSAVWGEAARTLSVVAQPADIDRALEWIADHRRTPEQRSMACLILQSQAHHIVASGLGAQRQLYERVTKALAAELPERPDSVLQLAARETLLVLAFTAATPPGENLSPRHRLLLEEGGVEGPDRRILDDPHLLRRAEIARSLLRQTEIGSDVVHGSLFFLSLHQSGESAQRLFTFVLSTRIPIETRGELLKLAEDMMAFSTNSKEADEANRSRLQLFIRLLSRAMPEAEGTGEKALRARLEKLAGN